MIITQAPANELAQRYRRLKPTPKLLMRLKSLLYFASEPPAFLECVRRVHNRAPSNEAWTQSLISAHLNDLTRLGLLYSDQACHPAAAHFAAMDAAASADAKMLFAAVRHSFPVEAPDRYYYAYRINLRREALFRLARLGIYDNDVDAFVAGRDKLEKDLAPFRASQFLAAVFAHETLDPEWLASRMPEIQDALLEARCLAFGARNIPGVDLPDVVAWYHANQRRPGLEKLSDLVPRYHLMRGDLTAARAALKGLDPGTNSSHAAVEGALAFLEGQNDTALLHFRAALKSLRKTLGRRKVFLDGIFGIFFLLALLRVNDPKSHAEIQSALDAALATPEDNHYARGFLAIKVLLWLSQGLEQKARGTLAICREVMPLEPISAACVGLAEYAVDRELAEIQIADHEQRFQALRDLCPLIARIHAEILTKVARDPSPWLAWLDSPEGKRLIAFTGLMQVREPWERVLESLDAFLNPSGGTSGGDPAQKKTKRLAWFVDPDQMTVEALEQSPKGANGWTDGRAVAMKRLREQDPKLDYLTAADRIVMRTIRKESDGWYGDDSYFFDDRAAIAALAGHPTVFDARQRSQPLELVSYPVELVISEHRQGYRIALSHAGEDGAVFLEQETPGRYRVISFSKKLLPVQEVLGREGLIVPKAAREQIIVMAKRDNPSMPVRAEIAEIGQVGVEGQAAPVVQLVPFEQGARLNLLVRPFGPEGPAYVAGLGGRSVLAVVGGQQLRANRDLPRELTERAALITACPTLRDRLGAESHELEIEDAEGCLDLLLELQAYTRPMSVEWPEGQRMRVSNVSAGKLKLRVGQDRDWFSVEGTVALDEDQVLEMRFLLDRLDKAQGRFVPLGDGQFLALTRQLRAQLQRLALVSEPHRDGRRVHALGAQALDAVLEDAGEVKSDAAWKRHVTKIRAAENWTPVLPPTLRAELRDYQIEGFVWMSRLARWGAGALLADDMGLGKTVQTIAVMLDRAHEGPCLVIAPTSVCPNWDAELSRFAPSLTVHRLAAMADRTAAIAALGPRDVLVCSYGLLTGSEALAGRTWTMLVLDEAQAIKNAETQRAKAVQTLRADFRLALTGTPVENYLDELWSLFSFVNPGVLGSREGFQKRFARPIERDKDPHARQALRALIRPFLLRRTKAAVLSELPPRTEQTIAVEMTEAERVFYEALRQSSLERLAASAMPEGRRKIQILAEITRLRRACCNPALIDAAAGVSSGKLAAFLDLVEELIRNGHKALVFSQFVGHLELVRAALDVRSIRYEYLDGGTPSAERESRVASFQAGGADLFLISLRAGGTGLNLTAADYVVHLDPWWNPAVEDQASDRAHRIGQERPVTIYRLIMSDSIEERILALHRDKRDLASELLDGTEGAARLSEEALLDLIRGGTARIGGAAGGD